MKKYVLITGANSGFGYLMTLKFAREGWSVFATARDLKKEGVKEITRVSKEEKLDVKWLRIDVTDPVSIKRAVSVISKSTKRIDALVNNAGFGVLGPIESYTTADFRSQFDTNFFGVLDMTYAFLPLLKRSKKGRIVNMSSVAGKIVFPAYAPYASSKHALEAYSEVLRYELLGSNVKVVLVEPGGFETGFSKNAVGLKVGRYKGTWFERAKGLREKYFLNKEGGVIGWFRDPQRVADKVFNIVNKESPRLRYAVGVGTGSTIIIRKITPDSVWEWIVSSILKRV